MNLKPSYVKLCVVRVLCIERVNSASLIKYTGENMYKKKHSRDKNDKSRSSIPSTTEKLVT